MANKEPSITHSPQSPFGPVFEGRTHTEGIWWASCVSRSPSASQCSSSTASWGNVEFISLKTFGEMSVLPLSYFFALYSNRKYYCNHFGTGTCGDNKIKCQYV